jgi:predicted glycosyltransferase
LARAKGVVAMGGYNTFCEILSFDRPALIVPRTVPRREQLIRAEQASKLKLVQLLADDGGHDPKAMARALHALSRQPAPSSVSIPGLLDGLDVVDSLASDLLLKPVEPIRTVV